MVIVTFEAIRQFNPHWKLQWVSIVDDTTCETQPSAADKSGSAFLNHIAFMVIAFGLFAPIGAVSFFITKTVLKLPDQLHKPIHACLQFGSFICSILGFVQMFFAHGGLNCNHNFHFQSLHSYIGIFALGLYWLQWPSALLVFTPWPLSPFKPGTAARGIFLQGHVFVGRTVILVTLGTIISGILALESKRKPHAPTSTLGSPDWWYTFANVGMLAFATALLLGFVFQHKPPATSTVLKGNSWDSEPLADRLVT